MAWGTTVFIIIGAIILIIGAVVSLHFWAHIFFVLPEAVTSTSTSTSTPTPLNSVSYAAFVGGPMIDHLPQA
jgi:hypothetical protein